MKSLLAAIAAAALAFVPASTSLAQDGGDDPSVPPAAQVLDRCVSKLGAIAAIADRVIGATTDTGVDAIATLDANDAPIPALLRANDRANNLIGAAAQRAHANVNHETRDCARALARLGAPDEAFRILAAANDRANAAIRRDATRGHHAVNVALRIALEDEFDADDGEVGETPIGETAPVGETDATGG